VLLSITSCTTNVVSSPEPGLIRITFQADNSDTTIFILGEEYTVDSTFMFIVKIQEARAFNDTIYTNLFPTIYDNVDNGNEYDMLLRENDQFMKYNIYGYYAPPESYSTITFALYPISIKIGEFGSIPIQLPPGKSPLETLQYNFSVEENSVTEINIQLSVFESIIRIMDSFYFDAKLEITGSQIIKQSN
jgi:hypothetical protein